MMIESEIERVVMRWAAEHPEPQYPTWEEWQKTNFPDAESAIFPCSFDSKKNVNRIIDEKLCLSATELMDATRNEAPWLEATDGGNVIRPGLAIKQESIMDFFKAKK